VNRNENEDGRASFLRGYYRGTGTCVVQEGRGEYGAHTVKNSYAGRARGTQGRDRSEGRAKGKKWWRGRKTKKQKKPVEKKIKKNWPLDHSRKSTVQPNQEDSESRPLNHMYLKKGSIWSQEVDL
jgi:hypothetical protein